MERCDHYRTKLAYNTVVLVKVTVCRSFIKTSMTLIMFKTVIKYRIVKSRQQRWSTVKKQVYVSPTSCVFHRLWFVFWRIIVVIVVAVAVVVVIVIVCVVFLFDGRTLRLTLLLLLLGPLHFSELCSPVLKPYLKSQQFNLNSVTSASLTLSVDNILSWTLQDVFIPA